MTKSERSLILEVGVVRRAHGLKGELIVEFFTDLLDDRTSIGSELHVGDEKLAVAAAKPHKKQWRVKFVGVDDRNRAEVLRGLTIRAQAIDDPEAAFVHELIGATVVDQYGTDHGLVESVLENPASDLLELAGGGLVPLTFFTSYSDGVIAVEVPPGLLDDDYEG